MKTIRLFPIAMAALALAAACNKIAEPEKEPVIDNEAVTIITAGIQNTKAALQSDGKKVYWENGDAISVNGTASAALSIETPAASADFSFSTALADAKNAVYPASIWVSEGTVCLPAEQAAGTDVSFAKGVLPMVARTASGDKLSFTHVAAVVKLMLKEGTTTDNIDYVEFAGRNGEQVSGNFSVDYSTGALTSASTAEADKVVRVNVGKALGADASAIFLVVPPGSYTNGFTVKVVDVNGLAMTKKVGATTLVAGTIYPTPETAFAPKVTIKDFAQEYVEVIHQWKNHIGTINRVSNWALAVDGDEDVVANAHYVPNDFTIQVGGKTYNTADMLEAALRSYLLLRGWDGNETEKAGLGNIPTATPVAMSETTVPETHGFSYNTPLVESSNEGYLYKTINGHEVYGQADVLILDNWAQRSLNWPFTHSNMITNLCGYPRSPITNYGGCFSSGRALITYAYFFKYMLDNDLDRADGLTGSELIRSELFGLETKDIQLFTNELDFGYEGGTMDAGLYAYTSWTATASDGWITVSPSSGSEGDNALSITAAANTGAAREGTVTITGGDVTDGLVITVRQAEYTEVIPTIKDFAQEYVKILDVWESTTGTIDMLKGENYSAGSNNVQNAHYVPSTTTITVGGKIYNTADMFETALRSYLLVRGYDGLDTEKYGKGSIPALAGGAVSMSTTAVPETHGYSWGASPYNETSGNGGHFVMGTSSNNEHCKVKVDALDNWAMRSLNYQHGQSITNLCGYAGSQLAGYYGCFCSQRALITYAFFFKYMLDNNLDKADSLTSEIIRTELFGNEG
ncbi:MAG: BACON domain-containing protein [Bacteroidales bacterium]|nr:BACON domain-containing protein [Bacteroidales bacterium]